MNCIYAIRNSKEEKYYVGQTINFTRRLKKHINDLTHNVHSNITLQNDWNQYGIKNFQFIILELCSNKELDNREQYWIKHYYANINGYNLQSGGRTSFTLPAKAKQKISNALTGNILPIETKQKISNALKGKHKGENNPMYGTKAPNRIEFTKEQIDKIKELRKNGYNISNIAKIFGCSGSPIVRILNESK